ncbi:phosphoadenosine phosphosulfate reductase family protein [Tamlana sp. 62-3]|uniref:Phosphoadenosine phosphosulfate reductase family protein n=1 Tax=Neotamlana sargassicola TaxID=2883125 RepID=A0A9X1L5K1_9FLAO|nr:phosphoadenosine phosphosulfate reductase family protein [Tamlana sargassicola]MCB4806674.1 phosphoadenosine phosphosulfate reductase family protein [Tamlana sargassicola]
MLGHELDIEFWNKKLRNLSPAEIIDWALKLSDNRLVTTSFGIYSAVLLSTITKHDKNIKVIWCDTLYNEPDTYKHAENLIEKYNLNIHKYQPLKPKSEIDATIGLPGVEDENHSLFSEVVKLEPFKRALSEHQPEVWFTNIRDRKTELRSKKDILSLSKEGILKVSPFYYWDDDALDRLIEKKKLPKNVNYFDPVKALDNRECGIHLQ